MPSGHGYIDLEGKLVIPTTHKNLFRFNEGLVRLRLAEGGWAFIDPQGKEQLRVERAMYGFSDGLALTGEGFVNPQGTVVLPVRFLSNFTRYAVNGKTYALVRHFSDGLAAVTPSGAAASDKYINKAGEVVLDGFGGGLARSFAHGKAQVALKKPPKGEASRLIDTKGECLASYPFKSMGLRAKEGLTLVHQGKKFGFVDDAGAWVLEPQWSSWAEDLSECFFSEGLCPVKVKGQYGFIDRSGQQVIPAIYDAVMGGFFQGVAPVKQGTRFGYLHPDGSWALEPRFTMAQPFADGRAAVAFDD
ncbi:hypothetical protein A176_003554 [Myxococcus hansupus]|uniref:WG repeat-containing protein n=1 Tax=Pseudomyxococcus hansupus TaxID=1297742 RepID=A0A0H4XER5_9BACT|nr:WG repeat-containing protein [Myxococcus hansupus]AKQ66642.1 hypothetical protein A176_003554 [Myxococcus hansupus]